MQQVLVCDMASKYIVVNLDLLKFEVNSIEINDFILIWMKVLTLWLHSN